jgi:EmrB/QacA subfamily drug resistance transporter
MQFLDNSSLTIAIPTIARDFGVEAIDLNLAILAYQLAMTVLIPVGTVLAERIGQRNAFVLALGAFMAGSVLSALSTSLATLIAARIVQGASSAVMVPVSRLLVVRSVDKHELMQAMNWLIIPGIVAPIMAPVVAGQIVTYASWHWIFLLNIPVALIGMIMALIVIPDIRDDARGPVDRKGMVLVGFALFGLMFGLEGIANPRGGFLAPAMLAAGAALLWLFIRHARASDAPVLDLTLFSIRSFRQSVVIGSILRVAALANGFLMPLWLQLGMGMSAAKAGAILVVSAIGTVLGRLVGIRLTEHFHPRSVAIFGSVLLLFGLLATSRLDPALPLAAFYAVLFIQGIAITMAMMVVSALSYVDMEPERISAAAGLFTTLQQVTMALGVMLAVWTLSAMKLFYGVSETDSRIYSGSYLILALLAAGAVWTMCGLDRESTGALRKGKG